MFRNLPDNFGLNTVGTPIVDADTIQDVSTGNTVDRIIKVCVILLSASVIASRRSIAGSVLKNVNIGAAALLLLAPLSALWSIGSTDTILRSVTLMSLVLISFAISLAGWNPRRFQQVVIPPLMYILIVSLVLGLIFPDRIIEIGDDLSLKDAWHGITLTKNQFGMTASIAVIIFANRLLGREGRAGWSIAGVVAAFACLIFSRSNTSLFATMVAVLAMSAAAACKRRTRSDWDWGSR